MECGYWFFQSKERLIQNVRNDIGGHFGSKAAIYAVPNLNTGTVGKIETKYDDQNCPRPPEVHFAGEIAESAFPRHLPGTSVDEQVGGFMKDVLEPGYRALASRAMEAEP